MSQYLYKPLDDASIRTLELIPGEFDDPLKGRIEHRMFIPIRRKGVTRRRRWMPVYEALSYAWGEQDHLETLSIVDDSIGDESVLLIGKNLASALRDLRSTSESRVIWCDAVCINQHDLAERATQVQRMADIYRHADRVVVWLAPENDHVARAFYILDFFASRAHYDVETASFAAYEEIDEVFLDNNYLLPLTTHDWHCVVDLVSLPWFTRLWVRQEITLANNSAILTSGRQQLLWSTFCSGFAYLNLKVKWEETVMEAAQRPPMTAVFKTAVDLIDCKRGAHDSVRIISSMVGCHCADPRDRVYGTLGFYPHLDIPIDYEKTVEEVYTDWVLSDYRGGSGLAFLRLCDIAQNPSWLPNLANSAGQWLDRTQGQSDAGTEPFLNILLDNSCQMSAIRCGTINQHISPMPQGLDIEVIQNTLKYWMREFFPQGIHSPDILEIDDLAVTVSGGRVSEQYDHGKFSIDDIKKLLLQDYANTSSKLERSPMPPPVTI